MVLDIQHSILQICFVLSLGWLAWYRGLISFGDAHCRDVLDIVLASQPVNQTILLGLDHVTSVIMNDD